MSHRKPKQKNPKKPGPSRPAPNRCRALVRVDGTRIRHKIRKDYEKARRDLEQARQQLDQYQQKDLPEFSLWLNSHFGALLTELRETSQKLAVEDALVMEVQTEVMFNGGSEARAYQRVMERHAIRETPPPPGPNGNQQDQYESEDEDAPFAGGPEFADEDEDDPMMEDFLNSIFGEPPPGGFRDDDDRRGGPRHAAEALSPSARLKDLYRRVVRSLHPDRQTEMTTQKTEWWHQAQAAYEAGDADQLEIILTLCDIGESGTTANTSVSVLQRITATLKGSVREIKRQLNHHRRDAAWDFSRRTDREALAERVRREMTTDLAQMRQHLRTVQELISRWKATPVRVKPVRGRKPPPPNMEFGF